MIEEFVPGYRRIEELEKLNTETLDELSRVKALNAELLEALKVAKEHFEIEVSIGNPTIEMMEAIIAKAEEGR